MTENDELRNVCIFVVYPKKNFGEEFRATLSCDQGLTKKNVSHSTERLLKNNNINSNRVLVSDLTISQST